MRAAQRFISTGSAVLVAIVGSGAVLLGTTVPAAASSPVPSSVPTLSSTAGPIIFGLGTHTIPERLATEAALGKKSGIVGSFANKTSSPTFWGSWARQVHDEGAVLQLYWDPTPGKANDPHSTLRAVLAGEHDAYIRSWARQVADVGYPVIIRLWAEMNGNWQPTSPGVNGNTAPEFVLAWRHVVNLARKSGANNILWNWNPDKPFTGSTSLSSLWPGSSYVDWIGLDVYNSGSSTNGTWKSFSSMMGPAVSAIRAVAGNKPLMIPEIGCGTNGDKAGWLHDMYASLSSFGVKAVVYFDYDMRTIEKSSGSDWRFSSPSSAMAAAKVAVHKAPIVGAHDLSVGKIEQLMARRSSLTPVADYTGDGKTDTATWRPTDGTWNVPGETPVAWGLQGDIPVDGDYTGGGKSDLAIFRPSTGTWWILGVGTVRYGNVGDVPVPTDYNGDGKTDIAVWRPSNNTWYVRGTVASRQWGVPGDITVPGDYNGDKKAEYAIYRPSTGQWWILGKSTVRWGEKGDIPVPGDYDGDRKTDIAIFRPSTGAWWVLGSNPVHWGQLGDLPVPGDYTGDGGADKTIYRLSTGTWWALGGASTPWGMSGDVPVMLPPSIRKAYLHLPQSEMVTPALDPRA